MKVCINGQGHLTKMATIPIYDKNLYKASSPEPGLYDLKLGMQHLGRKLYKALQSWYKLLFLVDLDLLYDMVKIGHL